MTRVDQAVREGAALCARDRFNARIMAGWDETLQLFVDQLTFSPHLTSA
jgi:hypothetical protein